MKHPRFLLLTALVAASMVTSCTGDLYSRTVPARTTATSAAVASPAFGSPAYVSSIRPAGPPYARSGFYPYSASHPGGMGYYDRVASPVGSFEYIYHDLEVPHPPPGTPLKEKTVRYTSHYPSTWGAPIWVTTFTPRPTVRSSTTTSTPPASGLPFAPGSE